MVRREIAVPASLCFVLLTATVAWQQGQLRGDGGGVDVGDANGGAADDGAWAKRRNTTAPTDGSGETTTTTEKEEGAAVIPAAHAAAASASASASSSACPPCPECPACLACLACPTMAPCPTTTHHTQHQQQQLQRHLKPHEVPLKSVMHSSSSHDDDHVPDAEKHMHVAQCALATETNVLLAKENDELRREINRLQSHQGRLRSRLAAAATAKGGGTNSSGASSSSSSEVASSGGAAATAAAGVESLHAFSSSVRSREKERRRRRDDDKEKKAAGADKVDKEDGCVCKEGGTEGGKKKTLPVEKEAARAEEEETEEDKTKMEMEMLQLAEQAARAASADGGKGSFLGRVSTELQLHQVGTPSEQWWGMEHFPPLAHAAAAANARSRRCVVVEVGAHAGTLALLAGKMGCAVYAFEADVRHHHRYQLNAALNAHTTPTTAPTASSPPDNAPAPTSVTYTVRSVGQAAGSRVDEVVPPGTRVTLLKVDIDSTDMFAMRGAEGLFRGGGGGGDGDDGEGNGVDFVNFEFSPAKHRAATGTPPKQYLEEMHRRNFDIYLLDCYFDEGNPKKKGLLAHGLRQRCLADVHSDYNPGDAEGENGGFVEVSESRLLLRCLMEGLGCEDKDTAALVVGQLVPPSDFATFAAAVTEVDLICVRRSHLHEERPSQKSSAS